MTPDSKQTFLSLVRQGIGKEAAFPDVVNWQAVKALADKQGLAAIIIDGIEQLPDTKRPPKALLLQWIGEVMQMESRCDAQNKEAANLGELFHTNHIRTYVLKGAVISECYPNPKHRLSADMDCFLLPSEGAFDAWSLGNDLVRAQGYEVGDGFYKNSSLYLPELLVENHKFMTPFRGNKKLRDLEKVLQSIISADEGEDRFEGTWLYRPPVMLSALFIIEHAYSHFLHEGLTWRMALDWMLFSEKHRKEICWTDLDVLIDNFGFRKFYDSFCQVGRFILGEESLEALGERERLMLDDIWAPLDLHKSLKGVKAKFQLAGNYWRARWKYKYFTEMTWIRALMEWVLGAVFDRHPKLD